MDPEQKAKFNRMIWEERLWQNRWAFPAILGVTLFCGGLFFDRFQDKGSNCGQVEQRLARETKYGTKDGGWSLVLVDGSRGRMVDPSGFQIAAGMVVLVKESRSRIFKRQRFSFIEEVEACTSPGQTTP